MNEEGIEDRLNKRDSKGWEGNRIRGIKIRESEDWNIREMWKWKIKGEYKGKLKVSMRRGEGRNEGKEDGKKEINWNERCEENVK